MSGRLAWALKAALTLALFVALIETLDLAAVGARLRKADGWLVAAAAALLALGYVLCGLRWAWMAEGLGLVVRRGRKVRLFFVGMFASLFLPSTIGGDVLRGALLARGRRDAGWAAAASVVLDRANGLIALAGWIALALIASPAVPGWLAALWALGVAGAWVALALGASLWPRIAARAPVLARVPVHDRRFRRRFVQALPLSALFQLIVIGAHALLGRAVGLELPWHGWILVVGLTALAATLPISLNGFGVREAGYVGLTAWLGGDAEAAAAMAALWLVVLAAAAAPGGWLWWRLGRGA